MGTLSGTLFFLFIAMLVGKHTKQYRLQVLTLVLLLVLAEVGVVLYEMYTMPMPKV